MLLTIVSLGWITSGPQVKTFEAKLSEYFGGRPVRTFRLRHLHDGDRAAHCGRGIRP